MKTFLFIPLFLSCFLYSSNPPRQHTVNHGIQPPINLTVPVSVHMSNNSTQQNDQNFSPHNVAYASSESKAITITKHWQQLSAYMAPLNNELSKLTSSFTHRWKLYTVGALYSALFIFLVRTNHQMNSRDSWAEWKNHLHLGQLQLHPQTELAHALLHDIQNRYMNRSNPTDGITPLACFITALEQEKNKVEQYLYITSWLSTLWLTKIFPFNQKKVEQARNARERLNFINHIFISWAATQNMNQITQ